MRRYTAILCLAWVLLLAGSPAEAQSLRLVTLSLPPFGFLKGNRIAGLAHELGQAIAEDAGYEVEETLVSVTRGMREVETGSCDMVLMLPGPEIEQHAKNLGDVMEMEVVILGRAGVRLESLQDVRGKRLAQVRGARYDERISRKNGMIVYATENYVQSLKLLVARRVDFALGPRLGLIAAAERLGLPRRALGRPLQLSVLRAALFVSDKTGPEMRRRLAEARQRLMDSGRLSEIVRNYRK
ncbi:substrate-binding periplasmic protein [Pseudodesulfovibrio cashew]|nr:transporter substrate-binding domain-containing protein [Pseudodesulfovibrio cashew]